MRGDTRYHIIAQTMPHDVVEVCYSSVNKIDAFDLMRHLNETSKITSYYLILANSPGEALAFFEELYEKPLRPLLRA